MINENSKHQIRSKPHHFDDVCNPLKILPFSNFQLKKRNDEWRKENHTNIDIKLIFLCLFVKATQFRSVFWATFLSKLNEENIKYNTKPNKISLFEFHLMPNIFFFWPFVDAVVILISIFSLSCVLFSKAAASFDVRWLLSQKRSGYS